MAARRKAARKKVTKKTKKKATRPVAKQAPAALRPAWDGRERRTSEKPQTLRLRETRIGFTVNDIERSIRWYRDVLGCYLKEEWREEGKLTGATMLAGAATFYLGQDDWAKGRDRKKGEGVRIFCTTGLDIDKLASDIKARGGVLDHDPRDQPWGERDFGITDPDGYKLTISTGRR
ncbi:MAG TPA: VOC family protein [Gemmatimonadales bacterium]|nr:VOC family protein [Gemmatimonadales bacterium]